MLTALLGMNCGIVQTGRVDPIISPGSVSSHVHKIAGGSSTYFDDPCNRSDILMRRSDINIDSTYDSMRNSSCTSCEIQADKSGKLCISYHVSLSLEMPDTCRILDTATVLSAFRWHI
jgi:hypothetical protein